MIEPIMDAVWQHRCSDGVGGCTAISDAARAQMVVAIKRAANTLYNLSQEAIEPSQDQREGMRKASEELDAVTKALGGNPYSAAWTVGRDSQ